MCSAKEEACGAEPKKGSRQTPLQIFLQPVFKGVVCYCCGRRKSTVKMESIVLDK